jgi:methylenetetrahydrofolate reductase (NADPH)
LPIMRLAGRIEAREFVITSELTPPKGIDLTQLLAKALLLKDWVDAFNLTDSPRARMAVEPRAVGRLLLERGIETVVQITARDRNRIAIQADLLGGALLGLHNFLFMAGDAPARGDHPAAQPVFDLNSSGMLAAGRALSGGHDLMGNPLKGAPSLFLGATANPAAPDLAAEVLNTRRKIDAGAQFLQTQAVYDLATLERFLAALGPHGLAIIPGVIPLKSARMAAWLNANVPGIRVPDELIAEMAAADAAGAQAALSAGIDIAARTIRAIRPLCAGVHIMGLGWESHIPQILAQAELAGARRGPVSPGSAPQAGPAPLR